MIKKIVSLTLLIVAALSMPRVSYAQYGQEVLGEQAPEVVIVHEPVPTGIEDHPEVIGAILLGASAVSFVISKKAKKASQLIE